MNPIFIKTSKGIISRDAVYFIDSHLGLTRIHITPSFKIYLQGAEADAFLGFFKDFDISGLAEKDQANNDND